MTKKQEIIIHVGFWTLFIGMNLYFDLTTDRDFSILWNTLQFVTFALLQIIIFYLNYAFICPQTVPNKRWFLLGIGQVFLLFLFPVLRHIFEEIIIYHITGLHNYQVESFYSTFYFFDNTYYAVRIVLLSLVFYFIKTTWNSNQKMNELMLQKKQAELQNLKNQLSPHFLFNTLNSFYADLMDVQPKVADDVLKLSDLLRYVTYENEGDNVYVVDEIQFLQNYIALFSRRFDNQLHISFTIENAIAQKAKIPSLLLIHFVENALKHGIVNDKNNPVIIQLKTVDNGLFFSVDNYFDRSAHYADSGIGYKNIRQRLELLFPENYVLDVTENNNFYQIHLQIPLSYA